MNATNIFFSVLSILIVTLMFSSCAEKQDFDDVNLGLKWIHQSQFSGNYVAKDKGFYEKNNLNVTIIPFSFEDPTIEKVVFGDYDFGIAGADELVIARSNGLPLKAIAVIYQTNPVCAYALRESGIEKPSDFVNKTIGLERGTNVDTSFFLMIKRLGYSKEDFNLIDIGYDATEIIDGFTDVSTGYALNEPHRVIEAGYDVNVILMSEYGVNMYADVIFTTEKLITENPELIKRFLKSTLDGWRYVFDNEEETIGIVMKYAKGSTWSHESYMLKNSIPMISDGRKPIGWMDFEGWNNVQELLLEQNLIERPIIINEVYTMEFLHDIYKEW